MDLNNERRLNPLSMGTAPVWGQQIKQRHIDFLTSNKIDRQIGGNVLKEDDRNKIGDRDSLVIPR